jgi:transcriptional regulator with XRE-family HTH domain
MNNNDRLPINRLNRTSLPFLGSSGKAASEGYERFSDAEMAEIKKCFAKRLREAFGNASNAEIARRCKTADTTIKPYADGERLPIAEMLIQMHRASGVSLDWLLLGKGGKRVETGNIFTEEEEAEIARLAKERGKSFNEMVRALATGAVEVLKKV